MVSYAALPSGLLSGQNTAIILAGDKAMPDHESDREIELKLEATPAALDRLTRARTFTRMRKGKSHSKTLNATYFDTPDFRLMQAGFALRLREGGDELVQTLKTSCNGSGPASNRGEWEKRLPEASARPDLNQLPAALRRRIIGLAGEEQSLTPRFETRIRRHISSLSTPQGGEVEMVIDQGLIRAEGCEEAIDEIELELKRGTSADLYRIALQLADIIPLQIGMRSKSERGRVLAQGTLPQPVRSAPLLLSRGISLEMAYEAILRQCLSHILTNQSVAISTGSPESLHQTRVGLRRLRSAFLVFGRVLDGEQEEYFTREARWLTRAIGQTRDLDVFLDQILSPVLAAYPKNKSLAGLAEAVATERDKAWGQAHAHMMSLRATRFLLALALYLDEKGWRTSMSASRKRELKSSVRKFAATAFSRRLKSVTKLASDISDLELRDRHELRKRLKKLRYAMSFFSSLFPAKAVNTYLQRLSALQDVFGALNDLQAAELILEDLGQKMPHLEAAGQKVLKWHQARADRDWKKAHSMWRAFRDEPQYWR